MTEKELKAALDELDEDINLFSPSDDPNVNAIAKALYDVTRDEGGFGDMHYCYFLARRLALCGVVQLPLQQRPGRIEVLEAALRLADVHVGWGDSTLENVHRVIRETLLPRHRFGEG